MLGNGDQAADSLLSWIAQRASRTTLDESLAGRLEREFRGDAPRRSPWWVVTDVVNPAQTYHRITHPIQGHDPQIARKLSFGRFVHEQLAPAWFGQLPGFATSEGGADGAQVGLPGVRGRLDFRVDHSIIELKTTELSIESTGDVISRSPQDLEQLVLYAIMTSRERETHKLVYYNPLLSPRFRVFKVRLLRSGPIIQHFRARMSFMYRAFEADDPRELGRCRYLQTGCDYRIREICSCPQIASINIEDITSNLEIERDNQLESRLEEIRATTTTTSRSRLRLWDLFSARQAFRDLTDISEVRSFVGGEDYDLRRWYERRISASLLSGPYEEIAVPTDSGEPIPLGTNSTIRVQATVQGGTSESIVLLIVRLAGGRGFPRPDRLSEAHVGQLGARCALKGHELGVLVVVDQRNDHETACYRIQFSDIDGISSRLKRRAAEIVDAVNRASCSSLPLCPTWLQRLCDGPCLCQPSQSMSTEHA